MGVQLHNGPVVEAVALVNVPGQAGEERAEEKVVEEGVHLRNISSSMSTVFWAAFASASSERSPVPTKVTRRSRKTLQL
ncbi:hypothetical protein TYRP_015078 [Tyrophagus putrescentiae]|nr:hypothetical protein TYRP_015078 [Tyrophagus putrescentiae]